MDDDDRRRIEAVEGDVRSMRHRVDRLSESVSKAQRTAEVVLERLEVSVVADVAEAKRVDLQFASQNKELAGQTKMIIETRGDVKALADAERRRASESLRVRAVKESDERRLAWVAKWWKALLAVAALLSWIAATLVAHWK